jgi:predicted GH43/DUF377 family glycosyl hydrolase
MKTLRLRILTFGFVGLYLLPVTAKSQASWFTYLGNPVVDNSWRTSDFDYSYALSPAVVHADSLYRMWYVGRNFNGKYSIGYAESKDGMTWQKSGLNPVLREVSGSSFESSDVWVSCVTVIDSGYRMYYSGTSDWKNWQLATAFSRDGIVWNRSSDNPILPVGGGGSWDSLSTYAASVLRIGPTDFRMWYTGQNADQKLAIGYANSTDGVHWIRYAGNPVLGRGPSVAWDGMNVQCPRVVLVDGTFHMFYLGQNGPGNMSVGYAYSRDGVQWTKYSLNPAFFSYPAVIDHSVLYENGLFRMWYSYEQWQIGYAISETHPVAVETESSSPLVGYQLFDGYPNPFNPSTTLRFDLPKAGYVSMKIYDNLGREVAILLDGQREAGRHSVVFDASSLASGLYFYRLEASGYVATKKLVLMK